jgi:hypothetical protein
MSADSTTTVAVRFMFRAGGHVEYLMTVVERDRLIQDVMAVRDGTAMGKYDVTTLNGAESHTLFLRLADVLLIASPR